MRVALGFVLALVSGFASAQTSQERIDGIWAVATNRMITQQDAWFDVGDFPACINLLKLESEKWPADYEIWTNLGWMEENVQDYDQALATYIAYKDRNVGLTDASLPEAQYYFMKKEYTKIPAILEPVIKSKCHPNNYRILAWTYEKAKDYKNAVRVWNTYLATGANDATAKKNLARDEKRVSGASSR